MLRIGTQDIACCAIELYVLRAWMSARVVAKVSMFAAPTPPAMPSRACMNALIAVFWRMVDV